ncbi:MFS general substrate transporter [Setomelanomma holmii]|uniref:MFS general substrate transporter n=1 Tax=Setomelanomma holmii TaxID=210430 RepID=A0A9P4H8Q0_9PLEO|nr:MFS general substrate transporter [Setomelanomma holmii]
MSLPSSEIDDKGMKTMVLSRMSTETGSQFNLSLGYEWFLTVTVCFISILTGLPAGSYATCVWNIGAALFPLVFVPLTENTGRMPGYFIAYIVFELSMFGSAFADNFATIVETRFLGGGGSSVAINIVGGSISDIWKGDKARSLPMSLFGFTSVAGIALGPFIGSAIVQIRKPNEGLQAPWRWYLRKETGWPIYTESELEKTSVVKMLKISFMRPTKMLLTEPVVIFFTLWISFVWGILFLFFSAKVQTFSQTYGFDTMQTGLVQLALTVGAAIGTLINPLQDWLYLRTASRNKERPGKPIPERRLYTSIPGSLLFTAGLFMYGWTSRPSIPWIVPAIGVAIVGVGIYSIYMGVVNYLTDAYEKYAASALSAASLGRNTFGAFLPFASYQLFETLGFGWAGSLLGFVGLALSLVPVVLLFKGREIRAKSPFMLDSTFDEGEATDRRDSLTGRDANSGPAGVAGGPPGAAGEPV